MEIQSEPKKGKRKNKNQAPNIYQAHFKMLNTCYHGILSITLTYLDNCYHTYSKHHCGQLCFHPSHSISFHPSFTYYTPGMSSSSLLWNTRKLFPSLGVLYTLFPLPCTPLPPQPLPINPILQMASSCHL